MEQAGADETAALERSAMQALEMLYERSGKFSDYLGWVELPSRTDEEEMNRIAETAGRLRSLAEAVIVVGIGGSYLGTRAVAEAIRGSFDCMKRQRTDPYLLFAGHNLSGGYLSELLDAVSGLSIAAIVVSKSGTTTEPALAFRIIREEIVRRYGRQEAARRIAVVADGSGGSLRETALREGYDLFAIPGDVGGRFSVLTPVGLLPLATAGMDIAGLLAGAREEESVTGPHTPFSENAAARYAAVRNALYRKEYDIEILASYLPRLSYVIEWWKQLFGESEGKDGKGIFPAGAVMTTDLHSLGQYIQDGERRLFETVIDVEHPGRTITVRREADNFDGLNYLSGRTVDEVNRIAMLGTAVAHEDGGVPNLKISLPRIDERSIGALLYFFEKACGISGCLLGVNPFDQPGVESYKQNMFALLDRPGYEARSRALRKRLKK